MKDVKSKMHYDPKEIKGKSVSVMLEDGSVFGIMRHNLSRDSVKEEYDRLIKGLHDLKEGIKYI